MIDCTEFLKSDYDESYRNNFLALFSQGLKAEEYLCPIINE